jgi:hypothetical protein
MRSYLVTGQRGVRTGLGVILFHGSHSSLSLLQAQGSRWFLGRRFVLTGCKWYSTVFRVVSAK